MGLKYTSKPSDAWDLNSNYQVTLVFASSEIRSAPSIFSSLISRLTYMMTMTVSICVELWHSRTFSHLILPSTLWDWRGQGVVACAWQLSQWPSEMGTRPPALSTDPRARSRFTHLSLQFLTWWQANNRSSRNLCAMGDRVIRGIVS